MQEPKIEKPAPYFGLLFCLCLFLALWLGADGERRSEAVAEKVLRLHVMAASDAPEDQARKLLVRDALLDALRPMLAACADAAEAETLVAAALPRLEALARDALTRAGGGESLSLSLGRAEFGTRVYESFALPAGEYAALRAVIGPGTGRNWWCVVFPPLCLAAGEAEEEEDAFAVFSAPERRFITSDGCVVKFRLLEWLRELFA